MSQPNRKARRTNDISFGRLMQTLRRWDEVQAHRVICSDIARDFVAGYVLSRLIYWFGDGKDGTPRAQVQRDGHLWVARTYLEWFLECRLTEDEVTAAYFALEKLGLIERNVWKFAGNPTTHVRIVEENFLVAWNAALDNGAAPDPVAWKAYKKEQAAIRKAEKEERKARNAALKNDDDPELVLRKFRKTKPGNSAVGKSEIPQLETRNFGESLTADTTPGSALDTAPDSKKGVDFSNQQQQQRVPRGRENAPDADVVVSKKEKTPSKPLPIPRIQTMEVDPNEVLPGLAAQDTAAPPDSPTQSATLLARLLSLETQNALAPVIRATCSLLNLTWPQIAAEVLQTLPEAQMTGAQLIERLNQDFAAAGLDEAVRSPRPQNEVKKDAAAVAWHLAVWRARAENPVGIYSQTARFLTRLANDEPLEPAALERLVAPVRAAHAGRISAEKKQQMETQQAAQRAAEEARAAAADLEASRWARACDAVIAQTEPGEVAAWRAEANEGIAEFLRVELGNNPGNATFQAAFERAVLGNLRAIAEQEAPHQIQNLIERLKIEDENAAESPEIEEMAA